MRKHNASTGAPRHYQQTNEQSTCTGRPRNWTGCMHSNPEIKLHMCFSCLWHTSCHNTRKCYQGSWQEMLGRRAISSKVVKLNWKCPLEVKCKYFTPSMRSVLKHNHFFSCESSICSLNLPPVMSFHINHVSFLSPPVLTFQFNVCSANKRSIAAENTFFIWFTAHHGSSRN